METVQRSAGADIQTTTRDAGWTTGSSACHAAECQQQDSTLGQGQL